MLKNYLVSAPFTRFIVIEDNLAQRGKPLLDFLLKQHLERSKSRIHYFLFQENINKINRNIGQNGITIHDFSSNPRGWDIDTSREDFESAAKKLSSNDIVFIDSIANAIYYNGLSETYKIFNILKHQTCVQQIVAVLHTDLLEDIAQVNRLFNHLCTLYVTLLPKFNSNRSRVQYLYKKLGGKIIKQIEEYYFEGDNFYTEKVEKIDSIKLLEKATSLEVNPENLTTFKIGLTDKDRELRDQLILPYLPQNDESSKEGKIIYQFEDTDDWDEEDPDDDLDI